MQEAGQVFCLGQGGSMLLANDICARFASLSTKFRTAGDSHLQLLTASPMNEADVVLFVSYSGATRDMMETLRTAKAAGAKIILLTHYEDSPAHCSQMSSFSAAHRKARWTPAASPSRQHSSM